MRVYGKEQLCTNEMTLKREMCFDMNIYSARLAIIRSVRVEHFGDDNDNNNNDDNDDDEVISKEEKERTRAIRW